MAMPFAGYIFIKFSFDEAYPIPSFLRFMEKSTPGAEVTTVVLVSHHLAMIYGRSS